MINFSIALEELKKGYSLTRSGWNGKCLSVRLVTNDPNLEPYFVIYNHNTKKSNTWVASVSDLLAEDWLVLV